MPIFIVLIQTIKYLYRIRKRSKLLFIKDANGKRRHTALANKVIIYTQETCPPCFAEKEWLKDHNIEFEERDIRKNQSYMQEVMDLGASATPVTVINEDDGKQHVIMGFKEDELLTLLKG
jgi:glutaredoxin